MKISIITVCWNAAATIEKTIRSVASQTYGDIEYIVIDGESNDDTLEIVQKYPKVVSKWISEPDKGLYDAMNKGIRMATGDYVCIINADDTFFDSQVVSKIAEFLKCNDINACIGDIVQHRDDGTVVRRYSAKNWKPKMLKIGFMPPHPAIFIKKEVFEKFGCYELNFKIGADYELITRFFLKNKITWAYSNIVTHRMLLGGISSSGWNSYKVVSKEIIKSLKMNEVSFNPWCIRFRAVWKIFEYLR